MEKLKVYFIDFCIKFGEGLLIKLKRFIKDVGIG